MICAAIRGPTLHEASQQISQALAFADIVELRLDLFESWNEKAIKSLQSAHRIPMIFTLRSNSQGGKYSEPESKRLADILQLASLRPEYLDIENHVPKEFVATLRSRYPQIKIIISYHDFEKTPKNLDAIYAPMQQLEGDLYKVALQAMNSLDALRLLCWAKGKQNLIAISMGHFGEISRILNPVIGSCMTYASLNDHLQTAPGQLPGNILKSRYYYKTLGPKTAIYGLIGDPIDLSISDITHNALFKELDLDAVFVKITVTAAEIPNFMKLAEQLPFSGLSVTMPLKECIQPQLSFIEPEAQKIGAVNTLKFTPDGIVGRNTDGFGALNALEKHRSVKGAEVIILGAGGAARAIAYEAVRRGANITILNRHAERAATLAKEFGCRGYGLDKMKIFAEKGYDIVINSTSVGLPIDPAEILPTALAMDVKTQPKITPFLESALKKGCKVVYGYEMFIEQAIGQFNLWFDRRLNENQLRETLQRYCHASITERTY